jgi:two-component sensor histidine kinase
MAGGELGELMPSVEQMVERQRVLADFGDFALRSEDLQEVLQEACRLVARALGTEFAKILEIQDDGQTVLVRAGVGWGPGIVGTTTLALSDRTSETFALHQRAPVITQDIDAEERFEFPRFMREHGVVSIANVPLFLPGGKAYGLLQVDQTKPQLFEEQDTEFLRTYATILGSVIDRLFRLHDLTAALERNERLMRELQHRIKNNIAVIRSLLDMRARRASSEEARQDLQAVGERVEALRLVHEHLYNASVLDRLELRDYLTTLVVGLGKLHEHELLGVNLRLDIEAMSVSAEQAIALGLIVNEFVTNSLKYAFDGGEGEICINVLGVDQDRIHLRLSDTGKGLAGNQPTGTGTGMQIIDGLCRQLGAEADWTSSEGTTLTVDFHV